jgi:hypothetical protein
MLLVFESPNSSALDSPDNLCVTPGDGILFVNIQGGNSIGSGMTCAITGPWRRVLL